jgi:replicative DNA helicase
MGKVIDIEEKRAQLKEYAGDDEVKSIVYKIEKMMEMSKNLTSYKSKLPSLDHHTQGFMPGELICISGPTKSGKTLLMQTITKNLFTQGIITLWFTFEMPEDVFYQRFGDDPPLIYVPQALKSADMPWVYDKILEGIEKFNIKVVFIDHLHFLFDLMRSSVNTSLQIGQVIRQLKEIAKSHRLVIFLAAHTNKVSMDGEMSSFQIRDSSFISQESDSVIMIRRDLKDKVSNWILIDFHRRTGALRELIKVKKQGNFFVEPVEVQDWHNQF